MGLLHFLFADSKKPALKTDTRCCGCRKWIRVGDPYKVVEGNVYCPKCGEDAAFDLEMDILEDIDDWD